MAPNAEATPSSAPLRAQLGFCFVFSGGSGPSPRASRPGTSRRRPGRIRQLALPLDHHPGTRQEITADGQMRVERVLRERLGPRVIVSLTSNRSTMISYRRRRAVLYVRAHAIFADAPEAVLSAVASFVSEGEATSREARLIDDWIELHRHHIRRAPEKALLVQPIGECHDLTAMLEALNREHFKGAIQAQITWSKAARNQRRTSIRMGSYCDEQCLIRIHPALDQPFVPSYFVESVVFHEMLHEFHGIDEKDGRRCIHTREFLADERRFPHYVEARRWEAKNLHKLLRY